MRYEILAQLAVFVAMEQDLQNGLI